MPHNKITFKIIEKWGNGMRKLKYILLLLSIASLFVAACGNNNDNNNNENAGEGGQENGGLSGEIKFWTLQLSPDFDDYINGMIDNFEEMHPGVTVNWQDIPFDQAEQRMLTSAAGGTLADVMNVNTDYLKKLAALGAVVNMDEAAADVKDDYFEGIWSAGELNGTVYALPWYVSSSGLLYNTELLERAGFSEPPTTQDEAWEMSRVIKEKTGAYGSTIGDFHLLLPQNGVSLVNEDGTQAAFNTPKALELLQKWKGLYDEGLIPDEILLGQADLAEWYAEERVAFWGTGPQLYRRVRDLSPEVYEKSDAAPAILGEAGVIHASIMNIAVAEKSKNKEAAIEFAKFVTNAENQLEFAKIVAIMPSVIEAAEDPFFQEGADSDDPSEKGKYFSAQQLEKAVNLFPPVEEISKIHQVINDEFDKVMLQNKDPQKALDDAEAQVNALL